MCFILAVYGHLVWIRLPWETLGSLGLRVGWVGDWGAPSGPAPGPYTGSDGLHSAGVASIASLNSS